MSGLREYEDYRAALKGRFTAASEHEQALAEADRSGQAAYSEVVRRQRQLDEDWKDFEQRLEKLEKRLASLQSRAGILALKDGQTSASDAPTIGAPAFGTSATGALAFGTSGGQAMLLSNSGEVSSAIGALADDMAHAEDRFAWIKRNESALEGTTVGAASYSAASRLSQTTQAQTPVNPSSSNAAKKGGCMGSVLILGALGLSISLCAALALGMLMG